MIKQPEALRLAEDLEYCASREPYRYMGLDGAAAELRRQHEVIAELLQALRKALPAIVVCERAYRNIGAAVGQGEFQRALDAARAAIKKAEEKQS